MNRNNTNSKSKRYFCWHSLPRCRPGLSASSTYVNTGVPPEWGTIKTDIFLADDLRHNGVDHIRLVASA